MRHLFAFALIALATPTLADAPRVVATTKPIHSLVTAIMGDLGPPTLLVKGLASPHTYSLRPSDAASLEAANLVFWTGPGMELFLEDALATLAPKAVSIDLSQTPNLELLRVREVGPFEPHEHGSEAHEEAAGPEADMHYWLDPVNAINMVAYIARTLVEADPQNGDTYADNSTTLIDDLFALRDEIEAKVAPVSDGRFILFHDATQYFENRFFLAAAGTLTVTPDTSPGAHRVAELRTKIVDARAQCVFAEPQFQPAIVATLIEGTPARAGTLDPEGALLTEGLALYRELLLGLAQSFLDCLAAP